MLSIMRCGDEQGMNSFLKTARLCAELVDAAHLRRRGDQFEDFRRDLVVMQDDLGGAKHAHCLTAQKIRITGTGSYQIDFAFHDRGLHWMPSRYWLEPTAFRAAAQKNTQSLKPQQTLTPS